MAKNVIILFLSFLLLILFSCDPKNESTYSKTASAKDSSSVTVQLDHYVTNMRGDKKKVETLEELAEILQNDYDRQDSLFIIIGNDRGNHFANVTQAIRRAGISNYAVIVSDEFFTLPYPKEQ